MKKVIFILLVISTLLTVALAKAQEPPPPRPTPPCDASPVLCSPIQVSENKIYLPRIQK